MESTVTVELQRARAINILVRGVVATPTVMKNQCSAYAMTITGAMDTRVKQIA